MNTNRTAQLIYQSFYCALGLVAIFAGFGIFGSKMRNERTGLNPHTKEQILIPAQRVPAFKAGSALKAAVANGKTD